MTLAIGFAVSLATLFYSVGINQPDNPGQTWMWQKMEIVPSPSSSSHSSVATFTFPKLQTSALRLITTDTPSVAVNIISLILGEESLFVSFNWTGGNWTLRFGSQAKD